MNAWICYSRIASCRWSEKEFSILWEFFSSNRKTIWMSFEELSAIFTFPCEGNSAATVGRQSIEPRQLDVSRGRSGRLLRRGSRMGDHRLNESTEGKLCWTGCNGQNIWTAIEVTCLAFFTRSCHLWRQRTVTLHGAEEYNRCREGQLWRMRIKKDFDWELAFFHGR